MSCEANHQRLRAVHDTWLHDALPGKLDYVIVLGDGQGSEPVRHHNYLRLPIPDKYENLALKTRAFFQYCCKHLHYDHIFKCDDDTYVHLHKLIHSDYDQYDYAGAFTIYAAGISETWHYGKCSDPAFHVENRGPFPDTFAEGFAYFISQRAVHAVADSPEYWATDQILEDVFVGRCIQHYNQQNDCKLTFGDFDRARWLSQKSRLAQNTSACVRHPLSPEEMRRYHVLWSCHQIE